jgi:hypothetical protein
MEEIGRGDYYQYNIPTNALKALLEGMLQLDPYSRSSIVEVRELFDAWAEEDE